MQNKLRKLIQESFKLIILEDKWSVIMTSLKLPKIVADWANNISEKFAIWIANDFKKTILKNSIPDEIIRNNAIQQMEKGNIAGGLEKLLKREMNSKEGQYRNIVDWLQGRNQGEARETDKLDLKTLNFEQALERANEWHDRVAELSIQSAPITDEDGEVIKTYTDKFYWIDLGKRYCEKEGAAMGHCGRGEGNLYSLRKDGMPYVTADILEDGTVRQLRGRANTKPKKEYHKYIIDLIKSDIIDHFDYWDYRRNDNFMLSDLEEAQKKELINQKPSLLKKQNIVELLSFEDLKELIQSGNADINEVTEKYIIENFSEEQAGELFNANPYQFNSIYLNLKYANLDELKEKLSRFGIDTKEFSEEGIKMIFDDWSDSNLINLFSNDDQDFATLISNQDITIDNDWVYTHNLNEIYNFPEINSENIQKIIAKLNINLKENQSISSEQLIELLEENEEEEIIDAIKRAYVMAQDSADSDEYFNKFVKEIVNNFGEYEFDDNDKLTFTIPYPKFTEYIKELEKSNHGSDELYVISDFKNYSISDLISAVMHDTSILNPLKTPTEASGDIDEEYFNEIFSEELN
jgi:hypothetical protein